MSSMNPCMDAGAFDRMVGNWIYLHRKKAGYSQLEFAKLIGLSQQHLAHVESGKRSISMRRIFAMRSVFDFTMSEFEAYIDHPDVEIAIATTEDIADIQALDIQLSDKELAIAIQEQQVYILKAPWGVLGVCCFGIFQREPYLHTLYVDQDCRKQGYDKELLAFWENTMKEHGYQSVLVSTSGDDTAKYFYEKLGYQYVGFVQVITRDAEELMYRKYFSA